MNKSLITLALLVILVLVECQGPSQSSLTNHVKPSELPKDPSESIESIQQAEEQKDIRKARLLVGSQVHDIIKAYPPIQSFWGKSQAVESQVVVKGNKKCTYERMKNVFIGNFFIHYGLSNSFIYPGSILMSNRVKGVMDGTGSHSFVPASPNLKNPTISVSGQGGGEHKFSYTMNGITQGIKGVMASNLADQIQIKLTVGTSDQRNGHFLGLEGQAFLKNVGLHHPPGAPLASFQKKLYFNFIKLVGGYGPEIKAYDASLPNTSLNTFFSSNLTLNEFNSHPTWWSADNPPLYVNYVHYGSIVYMTVDYNQETQQLHQQFKLQMNNGPTATRPIINQILSHSSLKKWVRGPFSNEQLDAAKNGDFGYKQNFSAIQYLYSTVKVPNRIQNKNAPPLFYSFYDFADRFVYFKGESEHIRVKDCTTVSVAVPKIIKILIITMINAPLQIFINKLSGQSVFTTLVLTPMILDLTPYLTDPFINVIVRQTTNLANQGSVGFIVNDVYTEKQKIVCSGSCIGNNAAIFTISKETGEITP